MPIGIKPRKLPTRPRINGRSLSSQGDRSVRDAQWRMTDKTEADLLPWILGGLVAVIAVVGLTEPNAVPPRPRCLRSNANGRNAAPRLGMRGQWPKDLFRCTVRCRVNDSRAQSHQSNESHAGAAVHHIQYQPTRSRLRCAHLRAPILQ